MNPRTALYMVLILGISGMWEYFYREIFSSTVGRSKSYVIFRIQTMLLFASALLSVTLIALGFSIVIVVASSSALLLLDILFKIVC